jgi:hypothetical protein
MMKTRLAAFAALCGIATTALAGRLFVPVSAPTMSEWGLVGLGLIVAVAAGITISRRK